MGDGSLSQDEIDALLQGADDMLSTAGSPPAAEAAAGSGAISPGEQNAIRDSLASSMGAMSV